MAGLKPTNRITGKLFFAFARVFRSSSSVVFSSGWVSSQPMEAQKIWGALDCPTNGGRNNRRHRQTHSLPWYPILHGSFGLNPFLMMAAEMALLKLQLSPERVAVALLVACRASYPFG